MGEKMIYDISQVVAESGLGHILNQPVSLLYVFSITVIVLSVSVFLFLL